MWKNHNGFTMIECILSLSVCMLFCLYIIPVIILLTVKAEEAEENFRMYEVAYEQVKRIQYAHQVQSHSYKDGREYVIELRPAKLCVQNKDGKQICIHQ